MRFFARHIAGRANDRDRVTGTKVWGNEAQVVANLVDFCQRHGVICNDKRVRDPILKGIVLLLVANREIITNGIAKRPDPFGDDVVDSTAEFFTRVVGFNLESADDQTSEPVQFPGPLQVPEHPIDAIEIFAGVLDEKDLAGGIDIAARTGQGLDCFEVSAHQLTFGRTGAVLRIRRGRVLHLLVPAERLAEGKDGSHLDRFGFCPIVRKAVAHFGVNRSDVQIGMDMAKQNGDIAKADDPFGVFQQGREIQLIDNMNRAIAAPGAEDGFDVGVVEHLLKIGKAFGIGAAVDKIFFSDGVAGQCPEAPALDQLDGGLDLLLP